MTTLEASHTIDYAVSIADAFSLNHTADTFDKLAGRFSDAASNIQEPTLLRRRISEYSQQAGRKLDYAAMNGGFNLTAQQVGIFFNETVNPSSGGLVSIEPCELYIDASDLLGNAEKGTKHLEWMERHALPLATQQDYRGDTLEAYREGMYLRLVTEDAFVDTNPEAAQYAGRFQLAAASWAYLLNKELFPPDFMQHVWRDREADEDDAVQTERLRIIAEGLSAACGVIAQMLRTGAGFHDVLRPSTHTNGEPDVSDGEQQEPALTRSERATLAALATFDASHLASAVEVSEAMPQTEPLSERTVRVAIKKLLELGLAERSEGDRQGARLTNKGRRLASRLAD